MRTALMLVVLISAGCWKEIHEASGPPPLDRRPAVATGATTAARRV